MLKNSLLILTQCFLHSLYYIIVFFIIIIFFFTPESTRSDGRGSRSIRWLHINMSVLLFLPRFTRTAGSFVIDFFFPPPPFPSLPRLQITPAPPLIPRGVRCKEKRKKGAATPAAAETSVSLSGCSVPACRPSHLECADETIRCNRRVAACCREGQPARRRAARSHDAGLLADSRHPSEYAPTRRERRGSKKTSAPGVMCVD